MNWRLGLFNLVFLGLAVVLDQVSKLLIFGYERPVFEYAGSWLSLSLMPSVNDGLAFSIPAPQPVIYTIVGLVFLLVLIVWIRTMLRDRQDSLFLALVIGGGIGNIIDRVIYGGVIDWIEVRIATLTWSSFNIADIAIVTGLLGALVSSFLEQRKHQPTS